MVISISRIKISRGRILLNLQKMDQQNILRIFQILKHSKEMHGKQEHLLQTVRTGRLKRMMKLLVRQEEKRPDMFELKIVRIQYMVIQYRSQNILNY